MDQVVVQHQLGHAYLTPSQLFFFIPSISNINIFKNNFPFLVSNTMLTNILMFTSYLFSNYENLAPKPPLVPRLQNL